MTYQLNYVPKGHSKNNRGVCVFDIEYYLKQSENDKKLWHSELHSMLCVDGITYFLNDFLKYTDFNKEEFINDAERIQNLRGYLWERHDNGPKISDEADEFHYHIFGEKLKTILAEFAKKYDMYINED